MQTISLDFTPYRLKKKKKKAEDSRVRGATLIAQPKVSTLNRDELHYLQSGQLFWFQPKLLTSLVK